MLERRLLEGRHLTGRTRADAATIWKWHADAFAQPRDFTVAQFAYIIV